MTSRRPDALFKATYDDGPGYLYLLFEHRSGNHDHMPLYVMVLKTRIWTRHRKNHTREPLPHILPLVISHTPGGWTAPTRW